MRIVAGTYEGFCYGWEIDTTSDIGQAASVIHDGASTKDDLQLSSSATKASGTSPQDLSLLFGYNVHVGCMKSVAVATSGTRAGQLLVTGGVDERVRIYDLRDKTELGELQQHNGTVTCMEFYKSTHLLTGSEDHALCIWRVHDWALLHVLGGHKAAVTSLSIHPSGRMALSVSRDRTLRLWNLLEGRCAYVKRLQGEGELVRWSPAGDTYLVLVGNSAVIYSAATSEPLGECKHNARVNSACFVGGQGGSETVATCADDRNIRFFRSEGGTLLGQLDVSDVCSTGRVRSMCYVAPADVGEVDDDSRGSLIAVTSTGGVHVWGAPSIENVQGDGARLPLEVPLLATHSVRGEPRFTCVTACLSGEAAETAPVRSKNSKKRKHREQLPDGIASGGAEDGAQTAATPGVADKRKKNSKRKKRRELQNAGNGVVSNGLESKGNIKSVSFGEAKGISMPNSGTQAEPAASPKGRSGMKKRGKKLKNRK